MDNVKVSVICRTYNQERYIAKCLDSLVSQTTNFNYEIIVHDDASTDSTANIVREFEKKYPDLIRVIYQLENQHVKGINSTITYIFPIVRGKYIAICEGDDFWTDPYKLQKQFDFMENNSEYVLCGHAAYYANEDGSLKEDDCFRPYKVSKEIPIEDIISEWRMATNSLFYRFSARGTGVIPFKGDCKNADYAQTVYLALKGKIYYIDEIMSAYRISSVGSLNWVWRSSFKEYKHVRMLFVQMLDRIDQYTEYKYHSLIEQKKEKELFNMYVYIGDFKNASKDRIRYKKLSTTNKCKLIIKWMFPKLYMFVRNKKLSIKTHSQGRKS